MDLIRLIEAQTRRSESSVRRTRSIEDLGGDVGPEVRAFTEPMRKLFAETGVTFREFASSRPFSVTSVSRYLSGERVPTDQHFRDEVLDLWVLQNNVPEDVAAEIADRLAQLQREALRVTNSGGYRKLKASENLAAAVHEREVERKQVRRLEQQLDEHRRQMVLTRSRLREIEGVAGRAEELEGKALELAADRARLMEDIARLTRELAEARQAQAAAEERCRVLELELENADNDAERERLATEAREQRRLIAEAVGIAEQRLKDIETAEEEADRARAFARKDADKIKILAVRKAEGVLKDAEQRLETATRQAEDIVADANARADRVRGEFERELAALAGRRDALNAQVANLKEMLALLGNAVPAIQDGASPDGEPPVPARQSG